MSDSDSSPGPEHPNCIKCGLWEGCKSPFMKMDAGKKSDILLIGEAPGAEEDRQGKPFIGKSGQILRGVMEEVFLDAAYTNTVRCRPPENKTPTGTQRKLCNPFLKADIESSCSRVAILLGNSALQAVTGYSGITSWRGNVVDVEGISCMPTFHPAAFLYRPDPEAEQQWLEDINRAADLVLGIKTRRADASVEYILADTLAEAHAMFMELMEAERCSYDLEFRFLKPYTRGNRILIFSAAVPGKAWALPLFHEEAGWSDEEILDVLDCLVEFLQDPVKKKIGYNIKIDMLIPLALHGIHVRGVAGDAMMISRILNSKPKIHDLKQNAGKYLNMYGYDNDLAAYVSEHPAADYAKGGDYSKVPLEVLWPYAAMDAAATLMLEPILYEQMDEQQRALYEQVKMAAVTPFTIIENNGCKPDLDKVVEYREIYTERSDELLKVMRVDKAVKRVEKANKDTPFNPNSSVQVADVLFRYKHHKPTVFTPTGKPSVSADVVKWIEDDWLVPYREWKLYSSALSKYLHKIPLWVGSDGRIRSDYSIIGTETGRTSSKAPNLQNIPAPEKYPDTLLEEYPIKDAFTCSWIGGVLLSIDFKAIELRVMASLSRAAAMIRMFKERHDPHTFVASQLYHFREEEIVAAQRYRAKWVNWTMTFGGSWVTLMNTYQLSKEEAKELEAGWQALFPEVLEFGVEQVEFAHKQGYTVSPFGMRRYFPFIKNAPDSVIRESERAAINHPIQSAASDLLVMSLIVVHDLMQQHGMKSLIINTVHDEIVFDVYPGELEALVEMGTDVMENLQYYAEEYFPDLDMTWIQVPLAADAEVGTHWGSMLKYKEWEEAHGN